MFWLFRKIKAWLMNEKRPVKEIVNRWPHVRLDQIEYEGNPCIDMMTEDTLDLLNTMCRDAERHNDWLHRINSSYRAKGSGQHPLGRAWDIVFFILEPGDVDVWEQYRFAQKYPWGGIGAYPFWDAPGIHCDTRQDWDHIATWWRDNDKKYLGIAEAESRFGITV